MAVGPKKPDEKLKPSEWNALRCECGGELFVPVMKLLWKAGGGSTETPGGYSCHACGTFVDKAYLIKLMDLRLKKQMVAEAQAEVNDLEGAGSLPPA